MTLDSAREIAPSIFCGSYGEAREKFRAAAPGARAYPSSSRGPSGEPLFTDVAYFGPAEARKLLVVISATHGPEGYCGSAAQLLFLHARFHRKLPHSTAVLFIHALNCYGFAWDRRVTAEGVDLNRNFVDFTQPLPQNPGYEELHEHFVPADISEESVRRAQAAIEAYKAAHGDVKYRQARMGGQYTHPGGIFYGGNAPTETRRTLESIAEDFDVASREQVIIIDYHTGMGPYGFGEPQCEQASGPAGYERARRIFGESTAAYLEGPDSLVLPGCQDAFWEAILGDRHTYIALEFGTFPPGGPVLREDAWLFLHRPEEADTEIGRRIRRATRDFYFPQADDWKEMVICRSHQAHRQALTAFGMQG